MFKLLAIVQRMLLTVACAAILFAAPLAFAQGTPDAGTQLQQDVGVVADGAQTIMHAAQDTKSPKWLLVIAVVLVLSRAFKRFAPRTPIATWLSTHPWGDWVVSVVISVCGALLTTIPSGAPIDLGLIMSAVVTGMGASGIPMNLFGVGPSGGPVAPLPGTGAAQAAGAAGAADPGKTLNS